MPAVEQMKPGALRAPSTRRGAIMPDTRNDGGDNGDSGSTEDRWRGLRRGDAAAPGELLDRFGARRAEVVTTTGERINVLPEFADTIAAQPWHDPAGDHAKAPDPEKAFAELLDGVTPTVKAAPLPNGRTGYSARSGRSCGS